MSHPASLLLLWLIAAPAALADDDLGAQIAAAGTTTGTVACASCHGPDGTGNDAGGFPSLAGLDAGYLQNQLQLIRDGQRSSVVMKASIGPISDDEIAAVAAYYAALPPGAPAAAADAAAEIGQLLAEQGDWTGRNIPACTTCHGPGGRGVGATFPAIAGQHPGYLSAQLQAWKSGTRTSDPNDLMGAVARQLSDDEIAAVSAWFAAQPRGGAQ